MARRKKQDLGIAQPAISMVGGATILGIGGQAAVSAGGSGAGMTVMAGYLPAMGTAIGAGLTIKQLRKLKKKK